MARSVHHHHRLLHETLEHAVKWQMILHNPVKREQIHILFRAAKVLSPDLPRYQNIGMRRGEILGLRWQDIDFQ